MNSIPKINKIDKINYLRPKVAYLKNNIKVLIFEDQQIKVCKLDLLFDAGLEFLKNNYITSFSNSLLREGTKSMSPNETADFFDYYGSFIQGFVGPIKAGLRLFVPEKYFLNVIGLFSELVKQPLLPEDIFNILKTRKIEQLKSDLIKTRYRAIKEHNALLFGYDHHRAYLPNPEYIEKIKINEIQNFVEEYYIKGSFYIQVTGKIPENIIDILNEHFGNLPATYLKKSYLPKSYSKAESKNISTINIESAEQASIVAGFELKDIDEKLLIDLNIYNMILGGYIGSRLMQNIREDKGYTYGIYSFITEYPETVVLRISADVGLNFVDKTIEEIKKEFSKLKERPIHFTELNSVRSYMLGEIIANLNGAFQTSSVFEKLLSTNKNEEFLNKQIERIKKITPKEIKELAIMLPDEKNLKIAIAGKNIMYP